MKVLPSTLFLLLATGSLILVKARGPLIWQEEFDFLDYSRWKHLITGWRGGNDEFQYYHNYSQNSYVRGGMLYIKPSLTADRYGEAFLYNGTLDLNPEGCNVNTTGGCIITAGDDIINPISSARMVTEDSFSFTYGTVETRAKMPKGDWLWPAIWMKPTDNKYGPWPRSGEIDIVEVRGNNNFTCVDKPFGRQLAGQTIHWGPSSAGNKFSMTHYEKINLTLDFSADFHIYRLDWLKDGMQFYIDDQLIGQVYPPAGGFWEMGGFQGDNLWQNWTNMAPFDQRFYFLVNVAVGGNFFRDGCLNVPFDQQVDKPWVKGAAVQMKPFWEAKDGWYPTWNPSTEDSAMQIDYIRVYALE